MAAKPLSEGLERLNRIVRNSEEKNTRFRRPVLIDIRKYLRHHNDAARDNPVSIA